MSAFADFLQGFLQTGSVVLHRPPELTRHDRDQGLTLLRAAHAGHALTVAGPPIGFDADAALDTAHLAWWACWLLVNRTEPPEAVERHMPLSPPPTTAARHLSADVVLRLLPFVHRRAGALAADDPLTLRLATLFRAWPLSGVLADLDDAPTTAPAFEGHPGLRLLYAERLADHPRPAWLPGDEGMEYVELVFAERGRRVPLPTPAPAPAST